MHSGLGSKPLLERSVQQVVKNAAKAAGITKVITKNSSPYICIQAAKPPKYIHITTKDFEKI